MKKLVAARYFFSHNWPRKKTHETIACLPLCYAWQFFWQNHQPSYMPSPQSSFSKHMSRMVNFYATCGHFLVKWGHWNHRITKLEIMPYLTQCTCGFVLALNSFCCTNTNNVLISCMAFAVFHKIQRFTNTKSFEKKKNIGTAVPKYTRTTLQNARRKKVQHR